MKTIPIVLLALIPFAGCTKPNQQAAGRAETNEDTYVITSHKVVQLKPQYVAGILQTGIPAQEDDYTITYGNDVLKVKYADSQTSSAKPADRPGSGLHHHSRDNDPDLSQVPQVGQPIRHCRLSKETMPDGGPIIAIQPSPDPCMIQFGDTLQYDPSPNGPQEYTYVSFDIVSEKVR